MGSRREESWLGFPSCLLMKTKKYRGKRKAEISLKGISDEEFEYLNFILLGFFIYLTLGHFQVHVLHVSFAFFYKKAKISLQMS